MSGARTRAMRSGLVLGLLAAVVTLAACTPAPRSGDEPARVSDPTATATTAPETRPGNASEAPSEPATGSAASSIPLRADDGEAARSHEGESLRLIVVASASSRRAAEEALRAAIPLFGDMQTYHFVAASDGFEGLRPGLWIVAEAYRDPANLAPDSPTGDNLALSRRAAPDAYVRAVTVRTSMPFTVYEDAVPGGGE